MPFIYFIAFATFFQTAISGTFFSGFSFFDEVLLIYCVIYLTFANVKDKLLKKLRLTLVFIFIVLVLSSFNSFGLRPAWMILIQTLIHLKFFVFLLFFLVYLDGRDPSKVIHSLFFLTVLGFIINLLIGSDMNAILGAREQYRLGELRPVGFQADTGNLGSMVAFSFIFYIFRFGRVTVLNFSISTFLMLIFGALSSVRTPFIAVVYSTFGSILKSPKLLMVGLFLGLSIVLVGFKFGLQEIIHENWEITLANFDWLDDPVASAYIRGIMIYFAFSLSFEYFPFGTGAASYGTVFSEGSWVYEKIGLASSRFFLETDGIYDSNFSSILGEFGYLGLFLYFFVFYRYYRYFLKKTVDLKYGVISFFLLVASYSLVNPIFMNSYSAVIYPLLIISLVYGYRNDDTDKNAK